MLLLLAGRETEARKPGKVLKVRRRRKRRRRRRNIKCRASSRWGLAAKRGAASGACAAVLCQLLPRVFPLELA